MEYKGRTIEAPLSSDDRAFLLARGKDVLVSQFDEQERAAKARAAKLEELGENDESDEPTDYNAWTADELRAEITERRTAAEGDGDEERVDALSGKGKKADLVKQLENDDELLADDGTNQA